MRLLQRAKRNTSKTIGELNTRLSECAQALSVMQGIDVAQHREEDLQDLKSSYEVGVKQLLEKISTQRQPSPDMLNALVELQDDLEDNKAAMSELLSLMRIDHDTSSSKLAVMTTMLDGLTSLATSRHGEIVLKLSNIEVAVNVS